jgi:hypothetical protein
MEGRPLFTVFGATGQQGGALLRSLLTHTRYSKTYRLRGVTRDRKKPASKALAERGVEIVEVSIGQSSLAIATGIEGWGWEEQEDAAYPILTTLRFTLGRFERPCFLGNRDARFIHCIRHDGLYVSISFTPPPQKAPRK